jgi:hypothetical protein
MALLSTHVELDELAAGKKRQTIHMRPIAYRDNGSLARIANDWGDGDAERPHLITRAPFMVSMANDGMRRIHPTRELDRYFEFGAPYIKPATNWQKVNLGAPERVGNRLQWTTANANLYVVMAGHYVKLAILLKNGWQPPNGQFAFPVGLTGMTRQGGVLLADGVPVMTMRAPHVEDMDNPDDVRPIAHDFVQVGGQWYALFTLPDLTGMGKPLIDPTLTLRPDGTDGTDTFISSYYASGNRGANSSLTLGHRGGINDTGRVLIEFPLVDLPDTAVISSITLSLYCTADYSVNSRTYRVYRQKRAWVEGTLTGAGTADGATWGTYDGSTSWQAAGGFGADDCEQTEIGTCTLTAAETLSAFKDFTLTPTSKADLDLGNGWLIKADTESNDQYVFASSDSSIAANRPRLTIEYTEGGSTPTPATTPKQRTVYVGPYARLQQLGRWPR